MAAVAALLIGFSLLWPATAGGWVAPRLMLLGAAGLLLITNRVKTGGQICWPHPIVRVAGGVLVLLSTAAVVFAADPAGVAWGVTPRWSGVASLSVTMAVGWWVGAQLSRAGALDVFTTVPVAVVVVQAVYAVGETLRFVGLGLPRPIGMMGSATDLGLLGAATAVWFLARLKAHDGTPAWLLWVGVVAAVVLVGLSGSRAAGVGFLIGLVVWASATRSWRLVVLLIPLVVVATIPQLWRWTGGDAVAAGSATSRLELWSQAWPLTGHTVWGAGGAFATTFIPSGALDGERFDDPHNLLLLVGLWGGVPLIVAVTVCAVAGSMWLVKTHQWAVIAVLAACAPTVLSSPLSLPLAGVLAALVAVSVASRHGSLRQGEYPVSR